MYKKIINLLVLAVFLSATQAFAKISISRVEPENWWTGMKKSEFQILVYGTGIGNAKVTLNYPGVTLKQAVKVENPNYIFLYINVAKNAKSGIVPITFSDGNEKFIHSYPLKARVDNSGVLGFNASDVLYLITPDRFANGNTANDNWDSVSVNRKSPNARHGGDYEGVRQKLDYMKDLGITTVWLNPIQENKMRGGSYHGYAITDFYQSDPRFGGNEEFKALTKATHEKGMKMVMDMVLNHCGSSHWWMKDLPSKDWINNDGIFLQTNHATVSVMDVHASETERNTFLNGWFTRGMPDLNQRNPHLATYLIQNSIWWIEYSRIDGIRQDTYSYMDFDFLARWNKEVYDEYPSFNIVGETWYNKKTSPAWWQANSILSKKNPHLKTPMDFSLTFTMQKAFDGETDNGYLGDIFEDVAQDFVYADPYNVLTFLDNHDLGRFSRKEDKDLKRYKQGLAFLLTTRGIPQIYYGTEVLMIGTKEDGDGRLRVDFPGGWPEDKQDEFTRGGRSEKQNEAWDYLQKLLQWRKTSEAVTAGKMIHYAPKDGIYVYGRIKDGKRVLVILNSSLKDHELKMDRFSDVINGFTSGKDVITSKQLSFSQAISVPAKGQYILELSK
ncbi:glycoside hydrolase family 13 protein [Pedobacter aquatilis]|uniref:glycoside hydrolase family 13 protein n=1 Tax=Pedobacter aquatilis TaxID=351343 RepID=UPI0029302209|nr:glycoside hydrolase family 13 protein [Pedobacter aquatilis]